MNYAPHPQQTGGSSSRSQKPLQQSPSLLQAPPVEEQFGERQIDVKSMNVQMLEQQFAFATQLLPMFEQTTG
jgi:hypothetical protein